MGALLGSVAVVVDEKENGRERHERKLQRRGREIPSIPPIPPIPVWVDPSHRPNRRKEEGVGAVEERRSEGNQPAAPRMPQKQLEQGGAR